MAVRLVIFGRQGAGKGTQSGRLSAHYGAPHISTGDMLRAAVANATPIGLKAKSYMDSGQLVPDEVMLGVVEERLAEPDVVEHGFLLDGFPRTVVQAEALGRFATIDVAVDLEVPEEVVLERISSRRVCADCGRIYSTEAPPAQQLDLRHLRWRGRAARRRHPGGRRQAARHLRHRDPAHDRLVRRHRRAGVGRRPRARSKRSPRA